jgi:hypothetical protein
MLLTAHSGLTRDVSRAFRRWMPANDEAAREKGHLK